VEITVARAASRRLSVSALVSSEISKGCAQCERVKPFHVKLNLPAGLLKEKTTISAIGISM
jgi:hypothetical protein